MGPTSLLLSLEPARCPIHRWLRGNELGSSFSLGKFEEILQLDHSRYSLYDSTCMLKSDVSAKRCRYKQDAVKPWHNSLHFYSYIFLTVGEENEQKEFQLEVDIVPLSHYKWMRTKPMLIHKNCIK